jgi:hypothetical protein
VECEERGKCGAISGRGGVGLPEEEDSRPTDRAGPLVSEGRQRRRLHRKGEGARWAMAGPEGGGREVGHDWAGRGRKRGGPRLGRKTKMAG